MQSSDVRQSFLAYFASKQHTIVASAPLLPTAPNLLFTNAGMNPFVPYFLGEQEPQDVRVANTQKCIRAGGKHNDLDDVGLDAYHQTFFEMLGNWSFGDYFKAEAIAYAWELLTEVWKFPKERLYVSVYQPGAGDPASFDHEAYDLWSAQLRASGLDPDERIVFGNKKDNFWMMGETGPCGPCSEIHIDLTPDGKRGRELVNADSPWCIELWNLVFIQFNADGSGNFTPLKNRHIDTGMGFERICGIIATTRGFSEFTSPPSNYNSDLFTPVFDAITAMCGHRYGRTLPVNPRKPNAAEMRDIAFRVIADHIRTLCCAIADGILPGNEGRNYVLRRILRRAMLYGRHLDLESGFFARLIDPVLQVLGPVFPELLQQEIVVRKVIASEEAAFARTIGRGLQMLGKIIDDGAGEISAENAFTLYDTHGFPLDLTELIAAERGLSVDAAGFHREMEKQRERARGAQHKSAIMVADAVSESAATPFIGFDEDALTRVPVSVLAVHAEGEETVIVLDQSPFYAEMGGQVGDCGMLQFGDLCIAISRTGKDAAGRFLHYTRQSVDAAALIGQSGHASVDLPFRRAVQRHHSATHILHHALREVLGTHVRQAGSLVAPDRLRFDFSHFEQIQPAQLQRIEQLCQQKILSNAAVRWYEVPFSEKPANVIAFFGEKYGDRVRVVDIGSWSLELCGGTHVRATGEIGLLKIVSESAIAAGVRRIEAVCGEAACQLVDERFAMVADLARSFSAKPEELLARTSDLRLRLGEAERQIKQLRAKEQAAHASRLEQQVADWDGLSVLVSVVDAENPNDLRSMAAHAFRKLHDGLLVFGAASEGKVALVVMASPSAIERGYKAGTIVAALCGQLGGKGGGKPDFAMGGGSLPERLNSTLETWAARKGQTAS